MYSYDPYQYYQQFQETVAIVHLSLPEAHPQAIREYILKRINTSQWSAGHVMSVIQAQAKVGVFIYDQGDVRLPSEFPSDWVDAPIVGFIEISDASQLGVKSAEIREAVINGVLVEHFSPWYIKYPARFKRFVKRVLETFLH